MRLNRSDASLLTVTQSRSLSVRRWFEKAFLRAFAWLATTVYRMVGDWRGWLPLFTRTSAHLAVISVAIVAIALSSAEWPAQAASNLSAPVLSASTRDKGNENEASVLARLNGHNGAIFLNGSRAAGETITRLARPNTIIPERPRLDIITYTIQAGDTVQAIADLFRLDPTTLMWANPAVEDAPDLLRIGQEVIILPIDGVYHEVAGDDTLASIAEEYKVEPEAIATCEYNYLESLDQPIEEGAYLIVPGGEKPYIPKVVTAYAGSVPEGARGTGRFQWPVLGMITQGYWYGHRAIDIGAPTGSAVLAADGGFVSFAGWTDVGYGYLIVIDHANGFATYNAHLSNMYVYTGQAVERGQVIGAVGSTGWSTGPHLHFEVRYYGAQQNPRAYLP
ncbi:MAG: M23 family metallopeptidase [Chloroflexi bacterium]|nr:M23 family metallopeptidase [Chloroflexota bacterium]